MRRFWNSSNIGGLLVLAAVIGFGIGSRLVPHAPGFVPLAALGLFFGFFFGSRTLAFLVLLITMLVSDAVIGFDSVAMRSVVYGSFLLPVLLGVMLDDGKAGVLRGRSGFALKLGVSSIASSLFFFATTNLAVWLWSGMYEQTSEGLALCYAAALPFLRNGLAGDLFYSGVFFGTYGLVQSFVRRGTAVPA